MSLTDLDFIRDYADGKIKLGLPWGSPTLDRHWRYKRNFTIILGHSGVGKTKLILYVELSAAIRYDHKVIVYTSENSIAIIKMELIEMLAQKKVRYNEQRQMDDDELSKWYEYVNKYMVFISQEKVYAWSEIRGIIEHLCTQINNIGSIVIDPYNSLRIDKQTLGQLSTHDYHYEVASEMRVFQKKLDVRLVVAMHPATEAARRTIRDASHPYTGYDDFPKPSDAEQGAKWKNRSDDFVIFHRIYNHPTDSNIVFIKVDKIKEQVTGGQPTPVDKDNFGIRCEWNYIQQRYKIDGIDILNVEPAVRNTNEKQSPQNIDELVASIAAKDGSEMFDDLPF